MKTPKLDITIIGLGTFGFTLAVHLSKKGHSILAIDMDEKKIKLIRDLVDIAIQADITDEEVLKKLELDKFDIIIFAMSSALESIILAVTYLRKMNVKRIIGKANTQIKKEILLKIGVDEVILPEISTAMLLAERIDNPRILDKFRIDDQNFLIEISVPKKFEGRSLGELDLRRKYGINVLMIKKKESAEIITSPELRFFTGDVLVVVGEEGVVKKVFSD